MKRLTAVLAALTTLAAVSCKEKKTVSSTSYADSCRKS